jgi:hypothetical protein
MIEWIFIHLYFLIFMTFLHLHFSTLLTILAIFVEFIIQKNFSFLQFLISNFKYSRVKEQTMRNPFLNYRIWSKCLFIVFDLDYTESKWSNHECIAASPHRNLYYHFRFRFWKGKTVKICHLITCNLSEPQELLKLHKLFEINFFKCLQKISYFHLF